MKQLQPSGTLILMGTPAEETGGGKDIMTKNGAWKGVSAFIMTHLMPNYSTPLCLMKASLKFRAKFYGKAAHAAGAPEE
jgi:metal-dependent amidase/aminoacylase/carboxypeptidase family protein